MMFEVRLCSVPVSEEWSVPSQNGVRPEGRMGHSSVYDERTGLVYVFGGHLSSGPSSELLIYDPVSRCWSKRSRLEHTHTLSLSSLSHTHTHTHTHTHRLSLSLSLTHTHLPPSLALDLPLPVDRPLSTSTPLSCSGDNCWSRLEGLAKMAAS